MELNPIFLILGLGGQELIFIMLIILLFFGAKKLPELARGLGKGIREFKDATRDVKSEIEKGLDDKA
jgi:sec-independent protein translocase protein TatA